MEVILTDPRRMYAHVVQWVRDLGDKVEVRDLPTREVTGATLILTDPAMPVLPLGVGRKINTRFAAVDALSLVAGLHRGELLDVAAPGWRRVLVDPERAELGAYGPRTRGQLASIHAILREDPTSRRAVMAIWRPVDLLSRGDRPCTLTLQFLLRADGLELHSAMRSQDVFLGLAYDLFTFTQLQLTLAAWLNVPAAKLVHHVGSFHLYERDVLAADEFILDPKPLPTASLPRGIIAPTFEQAEGRLFTPIDVAKNLLTKVPYYSVAQANPWYRAELRKIWEKMPNA